jgi:hypothetical protein
MNVPKASVASTSHLLGTAGDGMLVLESTDNVLRKLPFCNPLFVGLFGKISVTARQETTIIWQSNSYLGTSRREKAAPIYRSIRIFTL